MPVVTTREIYEQLDPPREEQLISPLFPKRSRRASLEPPVSDTVDLLEKSMTVKVIETESLMSSYEEVEETVNKMQRRQNIGLKVMKD